MAAQPPREAIIMTGIFAFMLHSHIPYCKKSGVWPAGEEWLFEAMNETYIPLLLVLRQLKYDNIRPRLMVGIVPILAEQLADEYMKQRFCEYMEQKILFATEDVQRFAGDTARKTVAEYWLERFRKHYKAFTEDFYRDILGTLKWLQDENCIEVLTSCATHGFLPLLERDSAIYSQVHLGVDTYRKYFGRDPKGIWLPECAYRPEEWSEREQKTRRAIDEWLADEGIKYFFVENIGILRAEFLENLQRETTPTTSRGYKLHSNIAVFGRNEATGKQVWSPDGGYPGDPWYREFHKKDAQTGLHYWRVTGMGEKQIYNPQIALEQVRKHADHFVSLLARESRENQEHVREYPPLIVSPYDCELFGHWWHEGVDWIDQVFRGIAAQTEIESQNLGNFVEDHHSQFSTIRMQASTWGLNGDFTVWQNPEHGWIWPYINQASKEFEEVLALIHTTGRVLNERDLRILRQTGRELLLLEGSDWPFLLYTKQAKEYANERYHHHHQRFLKLIWAAKNFDEPHRLAEHDLEVMEGIDSPWPDLNHHIFRDR